jgi:predicted nucleic acid-binding protein
MEIKSVFLDANIFIDANDNNRKSYLECYKIIPYLLNNNIKIYTSCDLITTIYYILSKINKLQALTQIEELNKICKIIEFSNTQLKQTCNLMREDSKFKDLEDAIQYTLAKNKECDLIISNDKKFHSPDINLYTSTQFIKLINHYR